MIVGPVKYLVRGFFGLIVLFYLVGMMFRQGYKTTPAQFEPALIILLIGFLCNIGPFFATHPLSKKYKKMTITGLLFSAFANFIMFLIVEGDPSYLLSGDQWETVRSICFVIVPLISLLIAISAWTQKNDI